MNVQLWIRTSSIGPVYLLSCIAQQSVWHHRARTHDRTHAHRPRAELERTFDGRIVSVDADFEEKLDDRSVLSVEETHQLLVPRSLVGVALNMSTVSPI
jgi:hypothetical protein